METKMSRKRTQQLKGICRLTTDRGQVEQDERECFSCDQTPARKAKSVEFGMMGNSFVGELRQSPPPSTSHANQSRRR
jgi:hypothetical protein